MYLQQCNNIETQLKNTSPCTDSAQAQIAQVSQIMTTMH